jgi:hypothetical protein
MYCPPFERTLRDRCAPSALKSLAFTLVAAPYAILYANALVDA